MPPKKKQDQIDLSTLPECLSANLILLVRGKKARSHTIETHIFSELSSIMSKISRSQILDFSKQKGIYVDPNTLNEKQKKDPKFMQSICTELTSEVFAKAFKAFIQNKNIKVRIDKKQSEAEQKPVKKLIQSKFDWFYLVNDVVQTKGEYESLAQENNVRFVLTITPKVNWSNSPYPDGEIPKNLEEQQQQDDQIKQFKQLKQKESFSQEDLKHEKQIQDIVNKIKIFRKQSKRQSKFRDTFIDQIQCDIDPYNQKQFNTQIVKILVQKIQKLSTQFADYVQWKNGKTTQSIGTDDKNIKKQSQGQKQALQKKQGHQGQIKESVDSKSTIIKAKGQSHLQILLNLVDDLYKPSSHQPEKNEPSQKNQDIQIQSLINGYDFSGKTSLNSKNQSNINMKQKTNDNQQVDFNVDQQLTTKLKKRTGALQFVYENQIQHCGFGINKIIGLQDNNKKYIRANLNFPGIDRYMMPEVPTFSKSLRKLNQSFYTKFTPKNMNFQQLERRLSLKKFQQILKDFDQQKQFTQSINQRVYEEFHNENSLTRELYRAMSLDQGHFISKYNPQNDKLYVALHYKTNQRRVHRKLWESNWRVIPNYQNWLKYFRQNQNNINNQDFYDIDYQKIGNIDQKVYSFCVPDGGVIIKKQSKIANFQNSLLYAIKNHHIFGVNKHSNTFYSQNQNIRIYHYKVQQINSQNNPKSNSQTQTLLILQNGLEIRLKQSGDIMIESKKPNGQKSKRLYTTNGYTILYNKSIQDYKILHPTGGISTAKSYINELGYGLKGDILQHIPTLLRRSQEYQIIKRDDNTITINQMKQTSQGTIQKKWIKFEDGTQYYLQESQIKIQKQGIPFVSINRQKNQIRLLINQIQILGKIKIKDESKDKKDNKNVFEFQINYLDGNHLHVSENTIKVTEELSNIPYVINLQQKTFTVEFKPQKIQISYNNANQQNSCKYYKNDKIYNSLDQQIQENEQQSYEDFLQPKLFIINSNNTGVELLSEKQLEFYFHNKEKQSALSNKNVTISKVTQKLQKREDCNLQVQKVYIISKLQISSNQKQINPNHKIKLDIYHPKTIRKTSPSETIYAVRTLLKYQALTQQNNRQLCEIISKKAQLFKDLQKDQNQFGHKTKDAIQIIRQKQKDKIIMIQFRKKEPLQKNFQQLKQQAIKELKNQQKLNMTMIEKQEKQTLIRNRMMERKKSVIQSYPQLIIKQKIDIQEVDLNSDQVGCFSNYFETLQGKKALGQMPEWVFRPKTAKQRKQLDPQIVSEMNNTMNKTKKDSEEQNKARQERYDTVDINLNPIREIIIKPSVFTQRQIDQERDAFQQQKKAYKYHQKKRKDFNIYGSDRQDKIQVLSLMRTQPISEINQKYLITEAPLDKKIKISSMKNKLTSQASSITQMRKQGPHNALIKTIDKRNDYDSLLQKRTMMVHADLNDKLQRDILINPIQANFGPLKQGKLYELKITIKNQDILAQRLFFQKPKTVFAKIHINQFGPIALGMTRKIAVQLKTSILGKFHDQFYIRSKHEIYRIPITANIISQAQYQNDHIQLEKNVKEIIQIGGKKGGRSSMNLPPLN